MFTINAQPRPLPSVEYMSFIDLPSQPFANFWQFFPLHGPTGSNSLNISLLSLFLLMSQALGLSCISQWILWWGIRSSSYVTFLIIVISFFFIHKSYSEVNMKLLLTLRGRVSCVFPDTPSLICGFGGSLKSVISIGFLFLSIWFIKYLLRVMVISCVKIALGSCLIVTITTQKNPETYLKVAEIWEGWYFECSKHG